ncbi:MAG: serine/threonine protein kinase [Gammaproteobacteria bacterium]|nr:serine/threonine protein kinase [Gammaproteobacteria bacterium]
MPAQVLIPIDDRTQVGEARRAGQHMAEALGLSATQAGQVALAVTEAATNIVKHAGTGKILLAPLARAGAAGLEILALDRGPGIANVGASLRDGYSTAGSMGAGLGALSRVSPSFELYSQPDRGTALRLEVWGTTHVPLADELELGAVCLPKKGEEAPGDSWLLEASGEYRTVLVVDGLGHGPNAAVAARRATDVFAANPAATPGALLGLCHGALAATRGAAGAAARVEPAKMRGSFAGVGNISCRVETSGERRQLVSHSGTLGHVMRRLQEFEFAFPAGALLILHSDGLTSRWSCDDYPGLMNKHPGLIAGVLYRDHDRGSDDVTVVVLKNMARA